MRTAADELVTILYDEGISHLFVSPGMHTTALRSALADAAAAGVGHPQAVLSVHEQVALCAAHGHHLAGGGCQAVMVHVEGGPLNLGGALENAHRDRIPVALLAGDVPQGEAGRAGLASPVSPAWLAGGGEVAPHPPPYVKWAVDLSRGAEPSTMLRRAFQIARAEPSGVSHVALPREMLHQAAGPRSRRLPPPQPPAPHMDALEQMAQLLTTATSPVIVAGRVGRQLTSVHDLAQLAETLGAPVVDIRNHVNLPPRHPLNAGMEAQELLDRADAILLLDVEMPCMPGLGPLPSQAWILQIDTDCLKLELPDWACPVEIGITASTALALQPLQTMVADRLVARQGEVQERRDRVEARLRETREAWRARATSTDPDDFADVVLAELDRVLPEDALLLEDAAGAGDGALRQMERPAGHFFRCAAPHPGWSLGAALGARLARPAQPVVALCDEVAFARALPAAAFWSAHREAASFLTVLLAGSGPAGARRQPEPDIASVARTAGAEVLVVDDPADIASSLDRLLATTRDGVCAVMDARVRRA